MVKANDQRLELKDQLKNLLEEARMVLPGIQALFGFQLIAVFQNAFSKDLSPLEQRIHLLAMALSALSAALAIAPASLQRRAEPDRASESLVKLSTRFLALGMWPLALAIALDFGILARMILHDEGVAWGMAVGVLAVFLGLWVVFPRIYARSAFH